VRYLVLLLVLLLSSAAWAQPSPDPPIEAIPAGVDKIVPLRKGTLAPYTGQLYEPLTALRWANWLQQYKYRLKWDVSKAQSVCKVEKKYRDDLLRSEEKRASSVEKDLRSRLLSAEQARVKAERSREPSVVQHSYIRSCGGGSLYGSHLRGGGGSGGGGGEGVVLWREPVESASLAACTWPWTSSVRRVGNSAAICAVFPSRGL